MSIDHQERHPLAAPLAHRVGQEADAEQIAGAIAAIWLEIGVALTPILGTRGVAALYKRSLHLTGAAHPWLAGLHEGVQSILDPAPLRSALARRSAAEAAAGASALLHIFHALLIGLVGPSLTERLLRSVWTQPTSGPPAQDYPS